MNLNLIRDNALQLLSLAKISTDSIKKLEVSHHYGLAEFNQYGAIFIEGKPLQETQKLIVLFAGQTHPKHFHPNKEEEFTLLFGDFWIKVNNTLVNLQIGQKYVVLANQWHEFGTTLGAVVKEAAAEFSAEAIYEDQNINATDRKIRKTWIET